MRERPIITRVVLENYKSIAFCDVKLEPLAILVGPNGAGKSNFLDALRFLSECTNRSVDDAFYQRSGFPRVLRLNGSEVAHLGIRVEFEGAGGTRGWYSIRFKAHAERGYTIDREKCLIERPHFAQYEARNHVLCESDYPAPQLEPGHLYLPYMAMHPGFSLAFQALSRWHFYNFDAKDLGDPSPAGFAQPFLRDDGSNLSNLLDLMWRRFGVHERIIEYLKVVNPDLKDVQTAEFRGFHHVEFLFHSSAATFSPREVSDGTLRALAVLVALFQARTGAESMSLVGLEEPESALHPAAAGVLFDALREASFSVQVLATTHSADLLDKKEIEADSILAVAFEDGATRIGPVDETGREVLRRRLYTAGELMRMNHLQPEPPADKSPEEIEPLLFGDLVSA
jgi:predicted ATPase